jgi:hypothetical protein
MTKTGVSGTTPTWVPRPPACQEDISAHCEEIFRGLWGNISGIVWKYLQLGLA